MRHQVLACVVLSSTFALAQDAPKTEPPISSPAGANNASVPVEGFQYAIRAGNALDTLTKSLISS